MTELVTAALEGDPDGIIMDTGAVYVMEKFEDAFHGTCGQRGGKESGGSAGLERRTDR